MNHTVNTAQLKPVFEAFSALEFAVLVGSRAMATAHVDSDWDIAIRWSRDLSPMERLQQTEALRLELAGILSVPPEKVDLIDLASARLAMRELVANHGQALHGENSLAWMRFLQWTWAEVEDFHWRASHAA